MMKLLGRLFWIVAAIILVVGAYQFYFQDKPINVRTDTVFIEPPCANASGDPVRFVQGQHKVFAERNLAGLTAVQDEKTILYDFDELSKAPPEYRDFVLRAACARNANLDEKAADCTAVKGLRDERSFSKEKVTLIAQHLPASSSAADDKDARTRNLYACFEARN